MFGKKHTEDTKRKISETERGKKISEETRRKIGQSYIKTKRRLEGIIELGKRQKGENHYRWILDRTQVKQYWKERNNPEYKQWRMKVWIRDGFKCKISNQDCERRIEAHHILGWSEYVELRYEVNNGITLCHAHHPRKRAEEKRLAPIFKELVSVSKE